MATPGQTIGNRRAPEAAMPSGSGSPLMPAAPDTVASSTAAANDGLGVGSGPGRAYGPGAPSSGDAGGPGGNVAGAHRVWVDTLFQGRLQIQMMGVKGKKLGRDHAEVEQRTPSVRAFLFYLEHEVGASPRLKVERLDAALKYIKDHPNFFPEEIARKGAELYDQFEEEEWGEEDSGGDDDDEAATPTTSAPAPPPAPAPAGRAPSATAGTAVMRLPPPNHPIWGMNGIMHGIAIKRAGQRGNSYCLDPRYEASKRSAKVIGANGLTPGDWWPMQCVALFRGAHGHPVSGISGSPATGAYSIVVSGKSTTYHKMDADQGTRLWYSADNSADNTNPARIVHETNRTRSLETSRRSGSLVRVLRSAAGGRSNRPFAPALGIRYDGLYRVVRRREQLNERGGLYYQFELVREPNQRPWDQTIAAAPTAQQRRDFGLISQGY